MTDEPRDVMTLISALASGDAARPDVVAALRNQKLDALDVLVELVAEQATASTSRTKQGRIDVQAFSAPRDSSAPRPVQRVPKIPVRLRGTLYDPQDITRFDGTELHFVYAGEEELVAIDDRTVMENLWQTSYLTSLARSSDYTTKKRTTDPSIPQPTDGGLRPTTFGGTSYGYACAWVTPPAPIPHTNFWEHINFDGDRLELGTNRDILDFRDFHLGPFWSGHDWNDKPSSIQMVRTEATVIWEDIHKQGQSFSMFTSVPNLVNVGWNDRTSSAVTWGATPWVAVPQLVCGPYNPTG